ncbi:MAG: polysaccharide biosynthesis protein [Candidatus Eisenbacteria bacterium]|nr:polysaccharide biosynthesis protein [Candidatus Eisenbacteria bacterium]
MSTGKRGPACGSQPLRSLIVGAGAAGAMVAAELASRPETGHVVVGFLDDDESKLGATIAGAPVLGRINDLAGIASRHGADQIIIAIPSARGRTVRDVVRLCEEAGRPFKIVPGVWEIILGDVQISQIREVQLDDLLGRETVKLDAEEMTGYLKGRRVLVTGAGGSIGSELARLVSSFEPGRLVLLGRGENSIYEIDQELGLDHPKLDRVPVIGSVRDETALELLFREHRPEVVLHAAAHKHVPLMEFYPDEAIKNNVTGTRKLIDAAARYGVDRLVMLSTDKAVRPRGVMGASKRLAELLLLDATRAGCPTKLIAVRFGNVLGSRGSVVPMFRQQIALGGPVTVTHPDVTRYFMTIREAAMLVLEAGFMGQGGEIFVLDMGDPIRIAELAEHLVRLSGLEPGRDIKIRYRGLRPGEKLHEELWCADEVLSKTRHDKVMMLQSEPPEAGTDHRSAVARLEALAERGDRDGIMSELRLIFPDMPRRGDDEEEPSGL